MKALLIIDMQAGSFTPETPRYDTEKLIEKINHLSTLYRETGNKVIFVQHDGTKEDCYFPVTPDWEILPELIIDPVDVFVSKTVNDSFYQTNLDSFLKTNAISHITITGSATDFCIEATIQSALIKDYQITVIEDGHTTADRPHLNAKAIIEHYNWVWQNMSPTVGSIKVIAFEDYLATENNLI
ncbi:cysteine hydrolase family protein [Dyadobacter sp. NIV53]|uniref:cysteine hydrolase family protein n=1 Tax=Dyadobacter sp. NIV53 TaxID=2861765 RepID=UPI001C87E734|nr:cysteine hydrolase family protein [Dyadobacter sp. NIV53]